MVGSPFNSLHHELTKIKKLVCTTPRILRMQNLVNSSMAGLVCARERERERERDYKGEKKKINLPKLQCYLLYG